MERSESACTGLFGGCRGRGQMTLEEEHEHNLIALDEKSRELRRHQGICRRAHEMIVDGDYELRSLLDLLASSWRKGKPAGMTPNDKGEPR